jgi:hypothetical protein
VQKAQAEAAATRDRAGADVQKVQADVQKVQAEAAATRDRAGADVQKVQAEAAATRDRAGADVQKVQADVQKMLAEAAATRNRTAWRQAGSYGALALAAALAADWVLHEDDTFIKWRLAAQLRSCRVPAASVASPVPMEELPVQRRPFVPDFRPVMVLAPTGAGKSTLLAAAARATASADAHHVPAPAVLVRIRHTPSTDERPEPSAAGGASEAALGKAARDMLGATAVRVYEQIRFPMRRAVLQRLFERGISVRHQGVEYEMQEAERTASRLVQALEALFDAAAAVGRERVAAGLSRWDAAPVLLFDEVQDLIRDDRLARAGGSAVFKALARLLVTHCVDSHAVRAAVSGSSALLSIFFDRTVASGFRLITYSLPDPEPEAVLRVLRARGYTADEAADIVALCGTRLRLLDEPLKLGAAVIGARAFMDTARATADAQFADLLAAASDADARALVSALDAALRCEAGTCDLPPMLGRAFTLRHAEAASKVLFLRPDRTLVFQSRLHAAMWRAERRRFLHAVNLK